MIGVSPAYFISRYGDRFTPREVASGLDELSELGFQGFQLEVFYAETLGEWQREGAARVAAARRGAGLKATQFVAHFLLHAFESPEAIAEAGDHEATRRLIEIVSHFPECNVVTIPLGAFGFGSESFAAPSPRLQSADRVPVRAEVDAEPQSRYLDLYGRLADKLGCIAGKLEDAGLRCAVELVPGAFVNGTDGLLRLFSDIGSSTIGYNFDAGHANASKENVALVPFKFGSRIYGTHLCDNFGNENLKLCPGEGLIDWRAVYQSLVSVGYAGALDVEIRCARESVRETYGKALRFVQSLTRRSPDDTPQAETNGPNPRKEHNS